MDSVTDISHTITGGLICQNLIRLLLRHSRTIVPDFKENVLSLFTNRQPQRRILIL